jgi:hypothetical protein
MKKKSTVLILLLALSLISMIPVLSMTHVAAEPVTYPSPPYPNAEYPIVEWYVPTGHDYYLWLAPNPEYLKLKTETPIETNTTIIVQGKDTYGQNIEATVLINGTHNTQSPYYIGPEQSYIFNDTHSGMPVAFAEITGIIQQNGTHNNKFSIWTQPEHFQEYLGQYHKTELLKWKPGQYLWEYSAGTKYLVGHGEGTTATVQDVPVEPSNPDPLKILINWHESDHDLYPDSSELYPTDSGQHATLNAWLWIEGLDQKGNKIAYNFTINIGDSIISEDCDHTWSSICKVESNATDSYYIFTHPKDPMQLFWYTILIDHITIHPACYDILAYPYNTSITPYPGVTNITVALRDHDGNLVHAAAPIVVNFATSGGKIQPSSDVWINPCNITATANLTADTNARTVNVTADANVPECDYAPAMNLFAWTELTFDGINSVKIDDSTQRIHAMMWGWRSWNGTAWFSTYTGPVPPKPWLPEWLGGPIAGSMSSPYKLDGPIYEVMIPLYVGCNLISCPVHPILCNTYMSGYPSTPWPNGIPMSLLFGNTSATTCIEAVWWYCAWGGWFYYIPKTGYSNVANPCFTDGVGYWIKAEKPCTLEISGVSMENAPFTPSVYPLKAQSWNLMGVTSITAMSIKDYLESINSGDPAYISAAGPVWIYDARWQAWARNPTLLYPTLGFWIYNKVPADLYIAP